MPHYYYCCVYFKQQMHIIYILLNIKLYVFLLLVSDGVCFSSPLKLWLLIFKLEVKTGNYHEDMT
jgi:hypothetical protein